jgi:protein involved in polysaccharide export with SLBB domain
MIPTRLVLFALALPLLVWSGLYAAPATAPAAVDVVGPDDLLDIGVADLESPGVETLKTVRVDSDGQVSLFLVGAVKIGGSTFAQAEKLIAQKYRDAAISPKPLVSLNRLEAGATASVRSGPLFPGDVLRIQVFDLTGKATDTVRFVRVSDGGAIGVPFLGQVKLAGMTEAQAENAILDAYRAAEMGAHEMVSVLRMRSAPATEPAAALPASRPSGPK